MRWFLVSLAAATLALAAQDKEFTLKVDVSLVSVDVGVYDRKGEAVTTLGQEDFSVFEDGVRQNIRAFEPSGVAFNALLVVDRSGSMRPFWESVVGGMNRFMEVLRVQDRVAIAAFDSYIEMVSEWRSAHSGRKQQVALSPDGRGTDFFGAVEWSAGYIRGEKGRKGVIVFSDGLQARGQSDFKKALQKVQQSNVPFYFIGTDSHNEGATLMKQFAEVSGGRAFFPRQPQEMVTIYEQIGRDLGRAYSISYAPSKPPDGKFRKIEVKPLDVRLHVSQSRDGYYAR
jgi:Ca-activated chloride channel family protein